MILNDATLPVTLQVDASEDAIGGVLLQNEQPVLLCIHSTARKRTTPRSRRSALLLCLAWISGISICTTSMT